jgi:5-methylcytosine-specific restriction endonuclease McrA
MRLIVLDSEPLCRLCLKAGKETASTVADHIIPHKNDLKLFYDRDNLQGLCKHCHSGIKRIEENHGYSQACDEKGYPLDPKHVWNLKK